MLRTNKKKINLPRFFMKIVNQFDGLNPVNSLILMASFVGINENFMYNVCQKFFNEINKQMVVRNR